MWGLESLGIPYNAADGTIILPWWAAAAAAGLIAILFVLALVRTGLAGTLVFLALVAFVGWAVLAWMDHERTVDRRVLEARLAALQAQASAPSSPLACLEALGNDTIEGACEREVFASPEAAAAAISYTTARVALLADGLNFTRRQDPTFDATLNALRNGLEQDRFGVVAHVLATHHKCSAERCDELRLFRDPARIRTNLQESAFAGNLTRAAPAWGTRVRTSSAEGSASPARAAPLPPGYSLPSSDSIPPVNIMTAEPPAAAPPSDAQGAAPPPPPRRPAQTTRPAQPRQPQRSNEATQPRPLPPPTRIQ